MDDLSLKNLSPAETFSVALDIQKSKTNIEDGKELMLQFCYYIDHEIPPSKEILWHARDVFKAILDKEKPAQALGLTRKKGKPKNDDSKIALAKEVLRSRLNGESHINAIANACVNFNRERTVVGEAWTRHKYDAISELRYERGRDKPWTPEDAQRLDKIFFSLII